MVSSAIPVRRGAGKDGSSPDFAATKLDHPRFKRLTPALAVTVSAVVVASALVLPPFTVQAADVEPHGLHHLPLPESGGAEVDLVLEVRGGKILGIEVKATSTPGRQHASGLARLRDRIGEDFLGGIVLHTGNRAFRMGEGIWAVPVPALWQM